MKIKKSVNKFPTIWILVSLITGYFISANQFARATSSTNESTAESRPRTAPSTFSDKSKEKEVLTLNLLRDAGLSLQQIKQQAINIYLEVTRTDVEPEDKGVVVYPKSISKKGLTKYCTYLPPRNDWLYYYVGTMEPVIHLFSNDVSDTKAGALKLYIPKSAQNSFSPVWKEWAAGIQKLNDDVTAIYELIDAPDPNNIPIGEHAIDMFKIGNELEKTRQKAVAIVRKAELEEEGTAPLGLH